MTTHASSIRQKPCHSLGIASPFHFVNKMDDITAKGDIIMFIDYFATTVTICHEFG
jgi:hypothetical protein